MKVLVTGALGFIGHHLCLHLSSRGYDVVGVDNLSRGVRRRIKLLEENNVKVIVADVRDTELMYKILSQYRVSAVVHLAALISVEESFEKPLLYEDVNAKGTISLVLAANKAGVERIVYASSAAVYGNPVRLPIDEDHPLKPLSPYGASKLVGEFYAKTLFKGNRGVIVLRLFNVYGPGQNPEYAGVITRFMERLSQGKPPVIYGSGEQTRDFIHVLDVVEAVEKALTTSYSGYVLNIGTGRPTKIKDLAYTMIKLYGLELEPVYAPPRKGDIMHSYADISLAKRILGWSPRISLEEGLRMLVESSRVKNISG